MKRLPAWALALAGVGLLLLCLPLTALLVRVPWSSLGHVLTSHDTLDALRLSVISAFGATLLSLLLGVPLAWALARGGLPGQRYLRALVTLPMVLPPVVGGVALLMAFGRRGVIGRLLELRLPFTTVGAVLAATFVSMPFVVVTVDAALRGLDTRNEEAAAVLGAKPTVVARRVVLPALAPALGAGAVLCWARALGEFGATITFAGSLPGRTRTLPLAVYAALDADPSAALALSVVLMALCVLVLVALRGSWLTARRQA